jgi:hypothetical protein
MSYQRATIEELRRRLRAAADDPDVHMREWHLEVFLSVLNKERQWYEAELSRLRRQVATLSGSSVRLCGAPQAAARHRE